MVNMSLQISDQKAFAFLSNFRKCVIRRDRCDLTQCLKCPYRCDTVGLLSAIDHSLEVLKARCPELHLIDDFQQIIDAVESNKYLQADMQNGVKDV